MGRAVSLQDGGEELRESRGVVDMIKVHSVPYENYIMKAIIFYNQ